MPDKKLPQVVQFNELEYLKEENAKLKKRLDIIKKSLPSQFEAPDEQIICEIEIERLKKLVMDRPLTSEETKKFDILVKTLNSVKKEAPIETSSVDAMSETELIELINGREEKAK